MVNKKHISLLATDISRLLRREIFVVNKKCVFYLPI